MEGDTLILDFTGKGGIDHHAEVRDARLAKVVAEMDELPGYEVFKYLDESDVIGQANGRMPDSSGYRQWEIAGSSHLDAQFSRSMAALGLRV